MLLDSPPRIVIDVRRASVVAAPAAPQAAEEPPTQIAVEPSPAASPQAASEPPPVPIPPVVAAPPAPAPAIPPADEAPAHVLAEPPRIAGVPEAVEAFSAALRRRFSGFEAAPALVALVALVFAWIGYRRLSARRTRRRALEARDEELTVFGDTQPAEPSVGAAAEPEPRTVLALAPEPESLPEPEPDAIPEPEPERTVGWQTLSVPASEPWIEVGSRPPAEGPPERVSALERRIARLEGRIDELLEARQRLERHAAAQNEELRVQRAAIARTQRVLRGIVRAEDQPGDASPRPAPPIAPE
jgi:hypothetical protein